MKSPFLQQFFAMSVVLLLSCKTAGLSSLTGQRTGGASFENAVHLDNPPDFDRLVSPFLTELSKAEPTLARVMMEFVRPKDKSTAFYQTDKVCDHNGNAVRAYIDYDNHKILFCQHYTEANDRDKLRIWMHELTHLLYYRTETPDNETAVITMEAAFMRIYDAWKNGDLKAERAALQAMRNEDLNRELPLLATVAKPAQDTGAFTLVPIFKGRADITYPVPKIFLAAGEAFVPAYLEVNMNRLWSAPMIDILPGLTDKRIDALRAQQAPLKAMLELSAQAPDEIDELAMWENGLLFPQAKALQVLNRPSNSGVVLEARTIPMAALSDTFKAFIVRIKRDLGIHWIRTLYRGYREYDRTKRYADDSVPACSTRVCGDYIFFFTE